MAVQVQSAAFEPDWSLRVGARELVGVHAASLGGRQKVRIGHLKCERPAHTIGTRQGRVLTIAAPS